MKAGEITVAVTVDTSPIVRAFREAADALESVQAAPTAEDLTPDPGDVAQVVEILGLTADLGIEQQARFLLSSNWLRDRGPAAAARIARLDREARS